MSSTSSAPLPLGSRSSSDRVPWSRSWIAGAIATLILGIGLAVALPGEVSWTWDEPMLLGQACYYNQAHELASRGLSGTLSIAYGPFPTQFYQLVLHLTHNVPAIVVIHAFCLSGLMAVSLLWLSRTLRLTPWYAVAVMIAPYLWWSERVLWDATFMLPIGMLGMAAYAAHLRKPSAVKLAVAAGAILFLPFIHMMALPYSAAFALHALWNFPRQFKRWFLVPIALVVVLAPNWTYLSDTFHTVAPNLPTIFHSGYKDKGTRVPFWISAAGPFLSGRLFDGVMLEVERHHTAGKPKVDDWTLWISELATPLICTGMVVALVGFVRRRINPEAPAEATDDPRTRAIATARAQLSQIALGALFIQVLLAAALRIPPLPQYCFGTFPIHVLFGWLAIDFLQRYRLGLPVVALWGGSLAFITLGTVWEVHCNGWKTLSPSLENQVAIATRLNEYSDVEAMTDVAFYDQFPMAIEELRVIMPPAGSASRRHSPHGLIIRYSGNPDPAMKIEVIERADDTRLDKDKFQPLDLTPYPRKY